MKIALLLALLIPTPAFSAEVYFGDLHVHTTLSSDAFLQGTRTTPDDAYRYAKGEAIEHVSGRPIQAGRSLDFLAVTDHAEYLGLQERLLAGPAVETTQPHARMQELFVRLAATIGSGEPHPDWVDRGVAAAAWKEIIAAADRHNAPGRFTTLVGFEWSATPAGRNLHRNVIFGPSKTLPEVPFSVFDSAEPEGLWRWMDAQRASGTPLLAIPHNSNLSDGAMFARTDSAGEAIDADYATTRARNEPLVEITQIKGTSETDPVLSPNDEFASFEIWMSRVQMNGEDRNVASSGSYVRDALKTGIEMQSTQGFNPYRFGLIGSTDSHSSSSPVEEDNYSGKGVQDTSPKMRLQTTPIPESVQAWSASGLVAVWAEENTREAIFDGLARKETYATTGPRIRLRVFAGWDYDESILERPDWVEVARRSGEAMGASLPLRPASAKEPRLLIRTLKDPQGANLERVQVVKGWIADGRAHEQVFDAAQAPPGGAAELAVVWRDPEFDAKAESFYYVRVLEVPTPRWSTFDAQRLEIAHPAHLPSEIRERAFGSPVWYSPR